MVDDLGARRPGESLRVNPYRTAAHEKGAEGEAYVGVLLDRLPRERWTVLHSVPVDGIGDIDHLVIGPPGVVAINTKNHSGRRVRVDGESIRVGSRDVEYARTARRHRLVVEQALARAGAPVVPVHTMIAVVVDSASLLTVQAEPVGVGVVLAEELPGRLEALPSAVSMDAGRKIASIASRAGTWGRAPIPRSRRRGAARGPARHGVVRRSRRGASAALARTPHLGPRRGRVLAWTAAGVAVLFLVPLLGSSLLWRASGGTSDSATQSVPNTSATPGSSVHASAAPAAFPEEPEFAYALISQDPLTRYLEASLARGVEVIAVEPWIESGATAANIERAVAEVSVRSPYVYVDGWDLSNSDLIAHYRFGRMEISTRQIRAALGIAQAADHMRALETGDTRQVVAAIHDWLAGSATYDPALALAYSEGSLAPDDDASDAASAFRPFGTIGLGYARAFAAIARELGVKAAVVTGDVDGLRHAWNTVDVDGEALLVDVALDDAVADAVRHDRLLVTAEDAAAMGYVEDLEPRP